MVDLDELKRLADAVIPADGWEVLKLSNGADVRARHVTGASTWIAECRTDADAAYIAAMHPDTAKKLIAVALAAQAAYTFIADQGKAVFAHGGMPAVDRLNSTALALRSALEELK